MIFKKINVIKKRRKFQTDFAYCQNSENFVVSQNRVKSFNFDGLLEITEDEYAKLVVDNSLIVIKGDGQIIDENGLSLGEFLIDKIFCKPVYIQGKEFLYVSDGLKSAFINCNETTVIPSYASRVGAFHKGRFYFYENGIFKSSVPMLPYDVDDGLTVDFLPYHNYGEVFCAIEYYNYVYAFADGGIFRFTEVSDRRINVENVMKSSVKILKDSVVLIGKSIFFVADDRVCKLTGLTLEEIDEFNEEILGDEKVIAGGDSGDYFIKTGTGKVILYSNGKTPKSFLTGVEVNSCGVFKTSGDNPASLYEVKLNFGYGFYGLEKIKCNVEKGCVLEVSVKGKRKAYSLKAGENLLQVGLYGEEFGIKITSTTKGQIIYSLEYGYYVRSNYESAN